MRIFSFFLFTLLLDFLPLANNTIAWDDTKYDTLKTFWPNGNIKEMTMRYWHLGNERGFRPHGQSKTWYENGNLESESCFDIERRVGTSVSWTEDGNRSEETTFDNGKRHGPYIKWLEDQNIGVYGHYKEDKRVGLWVYRSTGRDMNNFICYVDSANYYIDDNLVLRLGSPCGDNLYKYNEHFVDSLRLWIDWEINNKVDWKEKYISFSYGKKKSGQKDGKWIKTNYRGEILEVYYYMDGKLILPE